MTTLEERVAELERRVGLLEAINATQSPLSDTLTLPSEPAEEPLVQMALFNKRCVVDDYGSHILFDCTFSLSANAKPARAVKGFIQFSDLFGDPQYCITYTINTPLTPGQPIAQRGIAFEYNQFLDGHQFVLGTDLENMRCSFKTLAVLYTDGTSVSYD